MELDDSLMSMTIENLSAIYDLPDEAIQPEMFDFLKIISMGAKKYAMNNWLLTDGVKCSESEMHQSMFNHLDQSRITGRHSRDYESGLDPLLHLACRALMLYTIRKRGIIHDKDQKPTILS